MRLVRSSPSHASLPSERANPRKPVASRRSSHDEEDAFQESRGPGGRHRCSPVKWQEDGRRECRSTNAREDRHVRENHTSSANDAAYLRYYSSSRCYPPRDFSRVKSGDEFHSSEKVDKHRCRLSNGAKRSKLDDASDSGRNLEERLGNGAPDCKRHLSYHERLSLGDREMSHHNSEKGWSQERKGRHENNRELRSRRKPSHGRSEVSKKTTDANYGGSGDSRKASDNGTFRRCKDRAMSDALRKSGREIKLTDEFVTSELCMVSKQFQQTMDSEMAADDASAGSEVDDHLHSDGRSQSEDGLGKSDGVPDSECDEEKDCNVQGDPYEMLASLLLEDSLDVEHDFEMVVNPGRVGSEFCGSIFEDDIAFCSHRMDFEDLDISASKANEDTSSEGSHVRDSSSDHRVEDLDTSDDSKENEDKASQKRDSVLVLSAVNRLDGYGDKQSFKPRDGRCAPRHEAERVFVDVTNKFKVEAAPTVTKYAEENDAHRLCQRLKQIEFGKNTLGYERYIELVPRSKRKRYHPSTPNPKQVCSKRSWDGQIRKWRRLLHDYDPPMEEGEEMAEDFAASTSSREPQSEEPVKASPRRYGAKGPSSQQTRNKAGFEIQRNGLHPIFVPLPEAGQASISESNAKSDEREDPVLSIYQDWTETDS